MNQGRNYNETKAFSFLSKVSNEKTLQTREVLKVLKNLKKRSSFLDIGAGSGDIFFNIADKFKEAIAVEPGKRMIEILHKKMDKKINMDTKVIPLDWERFYKENNKEFRGHFNLIIGIHIIYFLKNPVKEIKKMLSLLDEGGALIIVYSYPKNIRADFVSKFRNYFFKSPYSRSRAYSLIKEQFKGNSTTKFIESKFILQDFKDLEIDHLSKKSAPTNYFLKFSIKKWFDELSPKDKKALLNYLTPLKKGDKYVIENRQAVHIIKK